jgi:hypothetical protein
MPACGMVARDTLDPGRKGRVTALQQRRACSRQMPARPGFAAAGGFAAAPRPHRGCTLAAHICRSCGSIALIA